MPRLVSSLTDCVVPPLLLQEEEFALSFWQGPPGDAKGESLPPPEEMLPGGMAEGEDGIVTLMRGSRSSSGNGGSDDSAGDDSAGNRSGSRSNGRRHPLAPVHTMVADGAALGRLHELCFDGWDDDVALSPTLLLRLLLTVLRCEDDECYGEPWAHCSCADDVQEIAVFAKDVSDEAEAAYEAAAEEQEEMLRQEEEEEEEEQKRRRGKTDTKQKKKKKKKKKEKIVVNEKAAKRHKSELKKKDLIFRG